MASELHAQRLDIVAGHVLASGARSVLDLGCGPGELIERLLPSSQIEHVLGIDLSPSVLAQARARLGDDARLTLRQASFAVADAALQGYDIGLLVETIEHLPAQRLGEVERAVFGCFRPRSVLLTTPNRDYNPLHGMRPNARRHPDHQFEWGRARFREWARGVASRNRYQVGFFDVGECDPELGASTQMARFVATRP
jgi:SAM-dependent methyltransferase